MYLELNLSEEGAHLAGRAQKAFLELGMGYEAAKAQTNLAISLTHHGDTAVALDLFQRARAALRSAKTIVPGSPPSICTRRWFTTGNTGWTKRSHYAGGPSTSSPPSPLVHQERPVPVAAGAHSPGARRERDAREVCLAALDRLEQAETPALSYQAWYVLGVIEEALGAPEGGLSGLFEGAPSHGKPAQPSRAEEMKIAFLKDKLEVYEALVRMCLDRDRASATAGNGLRLCRSRPNRAAWPT